jgi:hypothetical protein
LRPTRSLPFGASSERAAAEISDIAIPSRVYRLYR